ncbi:MAG: YciI family protein, partial [Ramlibacter sp.]
LKPSSAGWRVQWDGRGQRVIDGPYAESKELIAGYTLIQVRSREEAMEWARRFPNPMGEGRPGEIEVRPLYEMEDFEEKGIHGKERFRALGTL